MKYAKRVLAMLSSCLLAALCVTALAAAPAHAEGNWRVEGSNITENVDFEGEKDSSLYSFLVPSLKFELIFETFEIDNGVLSGEGKGTAKLLFTDGKLATLVPTLTLLPKCEVGDLLFNIKFSLFLHNGKTYMYVEPAQGNLLTTTTYSETCAITEINEVTGSFVLESVGGSFEEEAVKHLVRQAPAELFPKKEMFFGENKMSLDGSWWMKLKGKWGGQTWSGLG